jgi:bacterioferritin
VLRELPRRHRHRDRLRPPLQIPRGVRGWAPSEAVKEEFARHAKEDGEHLDLLAERINQLGGRPELNPEGLVARAATDYVEAANLVDMIKEYLIAERVAVETYREMVRYCGDKDTTRVLLGGDSRTGS